MYPSQSCVLKKKENDNNKNWKLNNFIWTKKTSVLKNELKQGRINTINPTYF